MSEFGKLEGAQRVEKQLQELARCLGMQEKKEKIYICSQYATRGNKETNLELAKMYCMNVIEGGNVPICPHLFYSSVLDDEIPSQREAGLSIGLSLLEGCDRVLVCSRLSEGMKGEIEKAWDMEIPVEVLDMSWLYSLEQAAAVEESIKKELEALYGKKHHTEAYRQSEQRVLFVPGRSR